MQAAPSTACASRCDERNHAARSTPSPPPDRVTKPTLLSPEETRNATGYLRDMDAPGVGFILRALPDASYAPQALASRIAG